MRPPTPPRRARPIRGRTLPVDSLATDVLGVALGQVISGVGSELVPFVGTGACGAFATSSSFSVDALRPWESGRAVPAAIRALSNLLLAVGAAAAASPLARRE